MIRKPATTQGRSECWARSDPTSWTIRRYSPWPRFSECWTMEWCWHALWSEDEVYSESWEEDT